MSAYYKLGHVVCYVITELYQLSFLCKSINITYKRADSINSDTGPCLPNYDGGYSHILNVGIDSRLVIK